MSEQTELQIDDVQDNDAMPPQAEQQQAEPVEVAQDNGGDELDEQAEQAEPESNPQPAKKLEPAAVAAPAEQPATEHAEPTKRGRGRPRKDPPPPEVVAELPQAKPAKPAAKAKVKPPLPDLGAAVAPQLDAKRQQQLDAVKGLLQLQASKIASLACLAVGWEPLNNEESLLVDAEFDGWQPPEEMRKVVVVGIVALPRALADNRCRKLVGLPLLGSAGDAPAARAAEVAASVTPPPPVVEPTPAQPEATPPPAEEMRGEDVLSAVSPIFAGAGAVKVPKGFV